MPRKAKTEETVEETVETKPARGRRRAKAAEPEAETKPARGRRRAKAAEPEAETKPARGRRRAKAAEPEPEAKPARGRRRSKAAEPEPEAKPKGRAKVENLYAENPRDVWDELDEGKDTRVAVNGENRAPSGVVQTELVDFIKGRGRKKVTAQNAIDYLHEECEKSVGYSTWTVANCLNKDVVSAA